MLLIAQGYGSSIAYANNEKTIIKIKEYDYATDINELLDLANQSNQSSIENNKINISIKGKMNLFNSNEEIDKLTLELQQLIKETTYSDGTSEKEYAVSTITLMDNNTTSQEVSLFAYDNSSVPKYWGKYDIACTVTAYITNFYGSGTETGIRLNYTTFVFNDNGSNPVYVSQAQMYSHGIYDPASEPNIERYATYNYPSSGTVYSLNSDDSRIYGGGGYQTLYCGAVVYLSDGSVSGQYDLQIILA